SRPARTRAMPRRRPPPRKRDSVPRFRQGPCLGPVHADARIAGSDEARVRQALSWSGARSAAPTVRETSLTGGEGMRAELIGVLARGLLFVIGTRSDLNMGLPGFIAAAGGGGLVLDQAPEELLARFRVDFYHPRVGLTYLFGFTQNNA